MTASSFRDCKAWMDEGLPLTTSSNEACKMYDAILTQYVTWRNDETVGGISGCMTAIKEADPNFGNSIKLDERLASAILVEHPTDLLALKFAHDGYFFTGAQTQIRDSVARVLPHWKPHMPLFSYLKGLYSFGLLETHFYDEAEKVAKEGLAMTRQDAWCVHSLAHVHEMKGEVDKGLKFLESTETNWQGCDILACHNYWHWALYFIEKSTGAMLDTVDACSLLYRLQLEGVCVKDRWRELLQVTMPHTDDHVTLFNDAHFLMTSLGAQEAGTSQRLMEGLRQVAQDPGDNYQYQLSKTMGVSMCQAMVEYDQGNYSRAVELLHPLRYRLREMGGSDAQRDVFNLLLIQAAMRSSDKHHNKLARCLLTERDAQRDKSPLTSRLIQRAHALHG
ncbi:hypothetical protein CRUP_037239 [Coryphaenoides rupestris]|nr:hypothetical protein CRUP_037239 [Coryphaenoides rupestris]